MLNYVDALIKRQKLVGIPDDDVTVENRYPKFPFAKNETVRRLQRKCLLIAEHQRAHPEQYRHLDRERARIEHKQSGTAPRVATPSTSYEPEPEPYLWDGIVETAPVAVRRGDM